jgi:signal transduction histidine kinase
VSNRIRAVSRLREYTLALVSVAALGLVEVTVRPIGDYLPGAPFALLLLALGTFVDRGPLLLAFVLAQVALGFVVDRSLPVEIMVPRLLGNALIDLGIVWLALRQRGLVEREAHARRQAEVALGTAEEAVASRDRFIHVAAHELRTPITALYGSAQVGRRKLARGQADVATIDKQFKSIEGSAQRLTRLLGLLLDATRIHTGRLQLDVEPTDLVPLLREAASDVSERHSLTDKLPVRIAAPRKLCVPCDRTRIYQVVVNLLENAVRYGGPGLIEIGAEETDEAGVSVVVRDHGDGIPAGKEETIFGEGTQAGSAYRQGLGLGLFISRQIAELHGGTLTGSNDAGGGAIFKLWLPRSTVGAGAQDGGQDSVTAEQASPNPVA